MSSAGDQPKHGDYLFQEQPEHVCHANQGCCARLQWRPHQVASMG